MQTVQIIITNWSGKNGKSNIIHIPRTNNTSQRHYKRINLYQDQSSAELFGLNIHKGKTNNITNHADSEDYYQ